MIKTAFLVFYRLMPFFYAKQQHIPVPPVWDEQRRPYLYSTIAVCWEHDI